MTSQEASVLVGLSVLNLHRRTPCMIARGEQRNQDFSLANGSQGAEGETAERRPVVQKVCVEDMRSNATNIEGIATCMHREVGEI